MRTIIQEKIGTLLNTILFFYGRYPKEVITRDLVFIVVVASEIGGITVAGKFLDSTLEIIKTSNGAFDFYGYVGTDSFYYLCISLLLWIFVAIGNMVRTYLSDNISDKVWKDTSLEIIEKLSNTNLQDIEQPHLQNLLDFIPNYSIGNMISSYEAFSTIIYNIVKGVSAFVIIFSHLGWISILLVILVLPEVMLSHFNRKGIQLYEQNRIDNFKLTNYIYSTLGMDIKNFMELRVDHTYDFLKRKYEHERNSYLARLFEKRKHLTIDQTLGSVTGLLFKCTYIVYLLAYVIIHKISIGTFSALFNYIDVVYSSSFNVFNTISLLSSQLSYASKYFEFIDYKGFGDEKQGYIKLGKEVPSLSLNSLDFAYPDEPTKKVLEDISIKIKPGEKVAFFGTDGSGKSSLIKVLTGLYEVTAGDYQIGEYSIKELARGELKSKLSVTFQNFVNYNFSIRENITLSSEKKNIDMKLYRRVLHVCEIDKFMKNEGVSDNLILGKYLDGKELSPGYWQRLAIARMLYRNRDIFIMDEPFTFIDAPSRDYILKNIFNFVGPKRTLILITRDTDVLDKFDKIYVLDKGKIIESGTWEELVERRNSFYHEVKLNQ